MSLRRVLLVVEGQHDEAFIATLLRARHGFAAQTKLSRVDPYWGRTIPRTFPYNDDLRRRMPVPYFYTREDVSLAIIVAVGESRLVDVVSDTMAMLPDPDLDAIGVVLDADEREVVGERYSSIQEDLSALKLALANAPGLVSTATPNCGVYVLPDNFSNGTLEKILIECAERNYQAAVAGARALVEAVNPDDYQVNDLRELNKPAGKNKAIVATITAILKPGKTTQASISDNRWLHGEASTLPSVRSFEVFLEALLTGQVRSTGTPIPGPQVEPMEVKGAPPASGTAGGEEPGS